MNHYPHLFSLSYNASLYLPIVPSMMMGHSKAISMNAMIPVCEEIDHRVGASNIPMSISEKDGKSSAGSAAMVYHVIPPALHPTSLSSSSSSSASICANDSSVHVLSDGNTNTTNSGTNVLMSHGIPNDEAYPLLDLIESLDPLDPPITGTTPSLGGLGVLFLDHGEDVISPGGNHIMSEYFGDLDFDL